MGCDLPPYVDWCVSWSVRMGLVVRIVVDQCGRPWAIVA